MAIPAPLNWLKQPASFKGDKWDVTLSFQLFLRQLKRQFDSNSPPAQEDFESMLFLWYHNEIGFANQPANNFVCAMGLSIQNYLSESGLPPDMGPIQEKMDLWELFKDSVENVYKKPYFVREKPTNLIDWTVVWGFADAVWCAINCGIIVFNVPFTPQPDSMPYRTLKSHVEDWEEGFEGLGSLFG